MAGVMAARLPAGTARMLGTLALAALVGGCGQSGEDTNAEPEWTAITDQQWPPGGEAEETALDVNPQRTNIVVVLDMSGSMGEARCAGDYRSKAEAARAALGTWIESVPREANLGLIAFSARGVQTLVPLGSDNRKRFMSATSEVGPGGQTPLGTAMEQAHELLSERGRHQLGYGRYQMVVITDGVHSRGEDPSPLVDRILSNPANPVEIHTIGFCIDDSALRQPGRVNYQSANNPEELEQGLSRVLAESSSFEPVEDFND